MPKQPAQRSDPRPLCPACGYAMQLARVVPRGGYIAEQAVFQCERCHVALTRPGERASG
jgi:transposase-like protein